MDATKVNIPSNIDLADKDFGIPGEIDMLIGCELFFELLRSNKFRSPCEKWLFQETVFGYIVIILIKKLQAFWKIEKVDKSSIENSLEEEICETQYQNTHYRTEEGRYVVQLPLKKDPYCLGSSRFLAEVRLNQLWKKLSKHYELQTLYKSFLQEYIDLNHMQLVADPLETNISYFRPHHGVFRPDSKTNKLRAVFNASSKTTSSLSLNDILYKGEILQRDLFSILLRFRQHTFVFTTDISKMFRQILINPGHRNLQMMLWKDSVDGPVQTYKLNTVTYGTTCAPYIATRTIQQLARDEGEHYPLAASVTIRDIYMDDILTGSSDFQEFQKLQLELISLFKKKRKLWVLKLEREREWDEPLSNPIAKEWNDFVSTLPVIQNIHVPRLVIGKAELLSMDLPTPQQQHMVLYYMLNRSQKRMYLQDSCAANPVLHRFLHNSRNPSVKASKAAHLEIVSYLTTDAFLATLKRFVARRGKCATISSDNAKNFVGANRELKRLHNLLKFPEEKLSSYISSEGISWNFMPPRAPNFGGLWEAGVKSFKFYLKRAVGNLKMTLEEFLTIITQIEGILNSRPITPLSEDIDDLEVLTPRHFLIGRPITSISEPNL
ncbi:integrase catalytic domain-containing protein [Trichonephila clavipes]|nr:integrase catalytic domain-containing protein [Trichonephila clavipes]